jgi:hypothetical protein
VTGWKEGGVTVPPPASYLALTGGDCGGRPGDSSSWAIIARQWSFPGNCHSRAMVIPGQSSLPGNRHCQAMVIPIGKYDIMRQEMNISVFVRY